MLWSPGFRCRAMDLARLLLFGALASACHAQSHGVVCRDGTGGFDAVFPTGVAVQVGAEHRDGLATRRCQGTLLWDKQKFGVAAAAAEVDVDALRIDLGLGPPRVTFHAKKVESGCCMTFEIYFLQKAPTFLRHTT